ncbi:YggS family pyridoxal phosphate-dependent enzyme [Luteolibacter ambystomatis]|uniref:Pyridoxal phosphate homeostasis protein n=1 Tax=Luteolibacter ambystomatis TaxID=2824561 RepID=A0A975G7G4_9BACT|nr:YggS family pyridoxal phosphate-dependent enzyme [Luteolibacter ambystomatis]QUE50171.1 YggS family pyridoxal phosphate-dependent enzyme [Luteolibacter ambystomatis]
MSEVAEHLAAVEARIAAACRRAGRERSSVALIAVSKTFPAESVADAAAAGQSLFGESRLQEAEPKIAASPSGLRWHFIGGVQRNKVRKILPLFEAIHAIDSLRLAAYTDQVAAELGLRPQVFLQVNAAGELSKGGFEPVVLEREMEALLALKHVEIRGLMTIPPDDGNARPWFSALRVMRDRLAGSSGVVLPDLSMGMSGDYEEAIEEGATLVRVGSAIFGRRAYRVDGELG